MKKSKMVQWMNKKIKKAPDMILSLPKGGIEKALRQEFVQLARNPQLKLRYIYLCENGHHKDQRITVKLERFKIDENERRIFFTMYKNVDIPVKKYGYEKLTNRAYINFTCPACGNTGLNGSQMIQNFTKCRECRAKSRIRSREKVERHPFKTWEDTPQFCASDFAFTMEEKDLLVNWEQYHEKILELMAASTRVNHEPFDNYREVRRLIGK